MPIVSSGPPGLHHGSGLRSGPLVDDVAVHVPEGADHNHDHVDQGPDAETAECKQLQDAGADLANVKTVDAEYPDKETQQEGREDALLRGAGAGRGLHSATAGASARALMDLLATRTTKQHLILDDVVH